ncbi:MAG: flagellar protein FliT [Methylobacter sp.]|nr:flagellar protein FliT [Methylobacter sp.]
MADQTQDIQQLVALSRTMLEKAREDSWDDVVDLEAERSGLIEAFFSEPVQQEYAETVEAGIRSIIAIDIDIMELGAQKKIDLVGILQKMDQGKKAVLAYGS